MGTGCPQQYGVKARGSSQPGFTLLLFSALGSSDLLWDRKLLQAKGGKLAAREPHWEISSPHFIPTPQPCEGGALHVWTRKMAS